MADTTISFTIPEAKVQRVVDALKGLYSIPQIDDPENEGETIPEFTDNQWAKESVRRWIRDTVARYEQKTAKDAIAYSPEDDLLS